MHALTQNRAKEENKKKKGDKKEEKRAKLWAFSAIFGLAYHTQTVQADGWSTINIPPQVWQRKVGDSNIFWVTNHGKPQHCTMDKYH